HAGFTVYPNPANTTVYIQVNSKATFFLINQAGKLLLIKNIDYSGTINVANLASGLYYLKNNTTGAVQKIIVSR
ncbi:MAG TPA: T9SS type A sorting domain-containing protein, partial [Panacibacter sp.]|nr:T9SS type A sorting domain-containing protein [Panacibacter sp.]